VSLPYSEGFEGVATVGAQIPCHVRNGDWTTQIGAQSQGRVARTGNNYAHTFWSTITGGDMYYFAPVTLTGGATYKASIWYNTGTADTGWTEFSMLYGTTQTDAGLINIASAPVDVDGNIITTGYQELAGTFTPATTGVYYIALRVVANGIPWYLMVDDFLLDQLFAIDMKPVSLVTPANVGCLNNATQSVVVQVQNNGTSAVNFATNNLIVTTNVTGTATATLTGTVNTGTLASGATLDVTMTGTLDMSVAGAYNFSITSNLTGDLNVANNTASVGSRTNVAPTALPQNLDFTAFTGANLATTYPGWYEAVGEASPGAGGTSLWANFTNTVATPGLGTAGNVLSRLNLYQNTRREWMVGPKFVATATSRVQFDVAVTAFSPITDPSDMGSDDALNVVISSDCGNTWTILEAFNNTSGITNTLTSKTVLIPAGFIGQQVIVALQAHEGATDDIEDYYLYVDNLRVYDAAPIDMAAVGLVSPGTASCYGANQTVTVKVKNLGALPMNFATNPTMVTVNVTGAVTQTLSTTLNTGTLAVDATQDVVVSNTFDMTAFGVYTFDANTNVTVGVDGDATNNAMLAATRNRVAPLTIPLPVADFTGYTDVEDDLDPTATNLTTIHPGWAEGQGTTTPTGTTSLWKSRTGLGSGTNTTTAFNFWSVRSAWLMTPKFTATPNGEIVYKTAITGWNNLNAYTPGMDNNDVLDVLVSTDCGVTWTVVKSYNQTNTNTLTNVLVEDFVNLSAYNGQDVIVAFRASTTASGNDYDFHLDDIAIKNCVPPSITTEPSALAAICAGTPTSSYTVAAAGDGLTYQWQADTGSGFTNVTDGINYSGATTATLNILNAPATFNAYKYRVVVTGRCGSINSSENMLTVNTTPVITTEAQNTTICEGANTSMGVAGTSFVAPTFKWQMRTSPTGAFADLADDAVHTATTTATLNFTNVPFSHNGYQYRCVINNTCGNTFSSPATLTVTRKPIITVQPVSQSGCANENYTFSVTATSDAGNLTYQWQEDEGEGAGFVNLVNDATFSGVATATLTITNIGSIFDGDKYRCIVTNDCGSTNTDGLAMYSWIDTQAPVFATYNNITFNASAGNTANCEQVVTFATPTATDNCANTPLTITRTTGLASGSTFPVGVTNMTYTATDAKNNVATLNFTITVVDDVNPVLVDCPANITVNNAVGLNSAVVNYTAPTATDNCAGVTVTRTTGLASGSTFPLGVTTITHEASDVAGNKVSCTFTVTVNFVNVAPTFTATNPATVLEDAGAQSIANWAIGNDNDEAAQTLTYEVANVSNDGLFNSAPSVDANGTLTYTLKPDANGTSTFQVRIKDNGGTANGGIDMSAYQTFTINVTAVNDKPTIGVPTYNLEQVAGTDLAVEVSGITAGGGADEANQTFSITNIVAITGANVVELPALPITITAGKANFNIKLVSAGEAQIRLTVKDNGGVLNGGVDTEERVFTIKAISQEQVFVPEMFSPNKDNDNDFFRVKAAKGIVQTIKLEVFDAQGNRVFYSDLIDRVIDTGWDGNNENGKPQPQGNYTWRLSGKFKDGRDIKATDGKNNNINKGNVFLFRGTN
jgi:gliding motility-associated-like protein